MTQPNEQLRDTIQRALDAVTPGPWEYQPGYYGRNHLVSQIETGNVVCMGKTFEKIANDFTLIANAPTWIRDLLEENKRLSDEYAEERAAHNEHVTELLEKEQDYDEVREERDDLHARLMSVESELQQTRDELERKQGALDEMFLNREKWRESHELISIELEQVKAEQETEHEKLIARIMQHRKALGYVIAYEVDDDPEIENKLAQSLHTELAAKDKVLQSIVNAEVYMSRDWFRDQARKALSSYPPREKGAKE